MNPSRSTSTATPSPSRSGAQPPSFATKNGPSPLRFVSTPYLDNPTHLQGAPPAASRKAKRTFDDAGLLESSLQSQPQLPLRAIMEPTPLPAQPSLPSNPHPHLSDHSPRVPSPSPEPRTAPGSTEQPPIPSLHPSGQQQVLIDSYPVLPAAVEVDEPVKPAAKRARTKKADGEPSTTRPAPSAERACGTTLLPVARVQKIMKADKELTTTAKEAVFLISIATEEFIKKLAQAGYEQARRGGRTTVLQKDLAAAAKRVDELSFLEDMIPFPIPFAEALEKREKDHSATEPAESPTKKKEQKKKEMEEGPLGKAFQRGKASTAKGKGKGKASAAAPPDGLTENGYSNGTSSVSMDVSREGTHGPGISSGPAAGNSGITSRIASLSSEVGRAALTDSEMDVS